MRYLLCLSAVLACLTTGRAWSQDYRAEILKEAAPADAVSPEIAELLSPTGVRVIRGSSRTYCDIWLLKKVEVPKLEPEFGLLYPFQSGQLIGVARYARSGSDFRDQDIEKGVYTLRFEKQPVDGAHVGTSITRDFLLLVSAEKDRKTERMAYKPLTEKSARVAETAHPALLSLKQASGEKEPGSMQHDEEHDWWLVRLETTVKAGDDEKKLPVDLVIVGVAAE